MSKTKEIGALVAASARVPEIKARAEIKALRKTVQTLEREAAQAHARAEIVTALKAQARKPKALPYRKNLHKRVATPLLLCSDWHVGERVVADKVNGVNAYDQHEARHRAERLADALLWLIEHHRNSFEVRELVLWAGGDLITGYLHPDQQQSNTLPPNKEVLLVQDLVGNLLDRALSLPGIERVIVPCSYGNHGRTTHKPQIATGAENSFEWLLYQQMARTYAHDSRVHFQIANGEFNYLKVHETQIRFTHGDAAKYGGGVGGITIPINKAIAKWQTFQHADLTCMGHFHNYHALPSLMVNGSLIGTSPYGMRVGSSEPPIQAFCLIDSKRGPCQHTPVWVADGKKGKK